MSPGLPSVSIVIPTFDAARLLPTCLASIAAQEFPRDSLEVLVVDGGSSDETRAIATAYDATVLENPARLAEPGVRLGLRAAQHDVVVVLAADNELIDRRWVQAMTAPFVDPHVVAAYTHVVNTPSDGSFCRYFNRLHADPFNWFIYRDAASPERFGGVYPVRETAGGHLVFDLNAGPMPLLALAQGFALRRDAAQWVDPELDDILPILALIESGEKLAYVDVGVGHHTVTSYGNFVAKYRRRTALNYAVPESGFRARRAKLTQYQRLRQYLWFPYAFSMLLPAFDALKGLVRDRDAAWLWHPVACWGLALAMLEAVLRIEARRLHLVAGST